MWKNKLLKASDELGDVGENISSFVYIMNELGMWGANDADAIKNIVYFLSKPYKWQREFDIFQEYEKEVGTYWFSFDELSSEQTEELINRLRDKNRR